MNYTLCVNYLLRNATAPTGPEKYWSFVVDENGNQVIGNWNADILGIPQPTMEELAALEPAAIAWEQSKQYTPLVCQKAGIVRSILQKYFGAGAEQNQDITFDAVLNYFLAKQMNGSITTQELADSIVLDKLYAELKTVTPDGTIWSFPWGLLT